jgi:hypothetical protein
MPKLELLEDEIGRKLSAAHLSGELRAAASFGKPMAQDAGWDQAPEEFRVGFKILKDAGYAPPEVELFHERARLREAHAQAASDDERQALAAKLSLMEQRIALRLEALRSNGRL